MPQNQAIRHENISQHMWGRIYLLRVPSGLFVSSQGSTEIAYLKKLADTHFQQSMYIDEKCAERIVEVVRRIIYILFCRRSTMTCMLLLANILLHYSLPGVASALGWFPSLRVCLDQLMYGWALEAFSCYSVVFPLALISVCCVVFTIGDLQVIDWGYEQSLLLSSLSYRWACVTLTPRDNCCAWTLVCNGVTSIYLRGSVGYFFIFHVYQYGR